MLERDFYYVTVVKGYIFRLMSNKTTRALEVKVKRE